MALKTTIPPHWRTAFLRHWEEWGAVMLAISVFAALAISLNVYLDNRRYGPIEDAHKQGKPVPVSTVHATQE